MDENEIKTWIEEAARDCGVYSADPEQWSVDLYRDESNTFTGEVRIDFGDFSATGDVKSIITALQLSGSPAELHDVCEARDLLV